MLSATIPSYEDAKNKTTKGEKQQTQTTPEIIRTAEQVQSFFNF